MEEVFQFISKKWKHPCVVLSLFYYINFNISITAILLKFSTWIHLCNTLLPNRTNRLRPPLSMSSTFCRIQTASFDRVASVLWLLHWPNGSRSEWGTVLCPTQVLLGILQLELQWTSENNEENLFCVHCSVQVYWIRSYQCSRLGLASRMCLVRIEWSWKVVNRFHLWPVWWFLFRKK